MLFHAATERGSDADIYFGDAAHIRSDHHAGRTWGAKGDTPIVQTTGARHGMSLISEVTSRGHMSFMTIEKGSANAGAFIEFLRRLIRGAEREIFLIVDRDSAHRAKKVSAFVPTLGGTLRLFFLPCAGPQPRRVGVEAFESGSRRPHGCDQSRKISRRRLAARCVSCKMTREKSSRSFQSPPSNTPREIEHTYGRINTATRRPTNTPIDHYPRAVAIWSCGVIL